MRHVKGAVAAWRVPSLCQTLVAGDDEAIINMFGGDELPIRMCLFVTLEPACALLRGNERDLRLAVLLDLAVLGHTCGGPAYLLCERALGMGTPTSEPWPSGCSTCSGTLMRKLHLRR
eukprot:TRINITY_DN9210_c0_g1_i1.p2 TRINITY_DN9210_c0_g1~~TRINITY_DN9210_c0_g1_i1.p2  ORF type:complete len:118 (-),score=16.30 TRINITY_DN9210_c0_g1_i1:176-529(-)